MIAKNDMRRAMRKLNRAMESEARKAAAERIAAGVERLESFASARNVALFCALPDEPETAGMIERWSRTKRVFLPRVEGDIMQFYLYDPARMHEGAFGIVEPDGGTPCDPAELDFILVPGVAFTRRGDRLGRGRGYYDKYLSLPGFRAYKAGVCYAHQLVEELLCEEHDMRADTVVAG